MAAIVPAIILPLGPGLRSISNSVRGYMSCHRPSGVSKPEAGRSRQTSGLQSQVSSQTGTDRQEIGVSQPNCASPSRNSSRTPVWDGSFSQFRKAPSAARSFHAGGTRQWPSRPPARARSTPLGPEEALGPRPKGLSLVGCIAIVSCSHR